MDEKATKTIHKRQSKEKQLLIEQLKKTPIIQIACEKAGVGRASYYRWRKEDAEFTQASDEALAIGNLLVTDIAESQLISLIKDKNMPAIALWLRTHHPAYATKVEIKTEKNHDINLTDEQKELLNKAIEMAALIPAKEEKDE